jgi:predicted RNA-binding protein
LGELGREELFPHRVKLEKVILQKNPLPFDQLIPKLRFITNKKLWTGHLRRAMRLIPKEDYEIIYAG